MQCNIIRILSKEDAEKYRKQLEPLDWQVGQARTKELTGTIKKNKELKPNQGNAIVDQVSKELCQLTSQNYEFVRATQMRQMMAYKFNNYDEPGGTYHRHTDAPWMGPIRTDFTAVLALTDPDTYEGGDHHVVDPIEGELIIRPEAGELILYETGYPHWVEPVEKGSRISALSWVESTVPDARKRGLLATARDMSAELEQLMHDESTSEEWKERCRRWFVDTGVVHSGMQRMWAHRN